MEVTYCLEREPEWENMAKRLKVANPARCIGCYSCMMACARTWYDTISLKNSRINIQTKGGIETSYAQIVCHACVDPPCMRACPLGALTKRKGGGVILNKEICDGCGNCIHACLMGAIHLDAEKKAVICKHCGVCPKFCPHDVLEMIEVEDSGEIKITETGPVPDTTPMSPIASHKELYGEKESEEIREVEEKKQSDDIKEAADKKKSHDRKESGEPK
ncbi:MAG: 4Fe-4S dicluster domain-containing protein [Methanosarcina sp.]